MKAFYQKEQLIGVSMCDAGGRLGVSNTFALFQDIASEHAELLGVGRKNMQEKGAFWVTTRTRVRFFRRPEMMQRVSISTWPAAAGSLRCDRFYRLQDDKDILAEGRTEWCVLHVETGRPVPPAQVFPEGLDYLEEALLPAPYSRYRHDFTDDDLACLRDVRPSDVDIGRHMNNVAYLRLICDSFTTAQLEEMDIEELEIWFCMPCFEGNALSVLRRETDYGYEFGVRRPDGRYAALAQMKVRK